MGVLPVHLQHEVRREVGYSTEALGLGLVPNSGTEIVSHHLLTCPFGQTSAEWHLGKHNLAVAIVLHIPSLDVTVCMNATSRCASAGRGYVHDVPLHHPKCCRCTQ